MESWRGKGTTTFLQSRQTGEFLKFLCLYFLDYKRDFFNEPVDAIEYDRVTKYLIPLLYITCISIINGNISSDSKNTISAFKSMG